MARIARSLTVLATAATVAAAGVVTAPAAPAQAATKGWRMYKTISSAGTFWEAAASSWWNAWAVGDQASGKGLAWRWNGHTWSAVTLPSGTRGVGQVSASSTGNTWLLAKNADKKTVLLRWNKGTWSAADLTRSDGVDQIGAAGANQLWAAGDGFIRHYTGTSWTEKALPDGVTIGRIAVSHYNDVWAVGWKHDGDSDSQPFATHWNGSEWTTTPVPGFSGGEGWGGTTLDSVAIVGDGDVFAAGDTHLGEDDDSAVLVHWNGTKWSKVGLPEKISGSWMGGVGVTPVGGGGIWYAWAHRHIARRTPSGTYTDYLLPSKGLPYVYAAAHIPGSKTALAVGSIGAPAHPFIALGH